ncbi:MAG: 50S ribosomal protein L25 [Parcubacteria group bacterium]
MEKVKLAAKIREVFGRRTNKGRKEGMIPAVVYGHNMKSKGIWVNALEFAKLLKKSGESTIIELNVGEDKPKNVLIYETQKDPIRGQYIHVDFFHVRMDEEIEKEVELVFIGEAPAVKELGGNLVKSVDEVNVKCLPADLPGEIEVDISVLKTFEDHICIKDLKVSDKVKFDIDPETVIASVAPPRSEAELEGLETKVEADVTKVEGVVKEAPVAEENKDKKGGK